MSPISFISTPPVIGLPSYLFKSILLEIQFLYNIWRYPYSWPGSSIFIFAVLLGFHCYKSVFPSISVWQDGSSIGRIDLPSSQKHVESTIGRMSPKNPWQDIGPMPMTSIWYHPAKDEFWNILPKKASKVKWYSATYNNPNLVSSCQGWIQEHSTKEMDPSCQSEIDGNTD